MDLTSEAKRLQRLADPAPGRVLYVLSALEIADAIGAGTRSTAELAAGVGADRDSLARVLRAAVELDVLAEPEPDVWELRPGGRLLRSDVEGNLRAELADNDLFGAWTEFLHSVRTGEPCYPKVFGAPLFDRLNERPRERRGFHLHMHARAQLVYRPLILSRRWPSSGVLVDVGGGTGGLLEQLLATRPELRGVLFDLPDVLELSPLSPGDRIEFAAGDVFADAVPGGDVHVLASVLHDWRDAQAEEILAACRSACGSDGELLVVDRVLPASGPRPQVFNDLLMLAVVGGRERTAEEWEILAERTGFRLGGIDTAADTELAILRFQPV
ncbi:methyltransferase [Saccharopolyspora pogona]|uniref:methyltransferase n=1 Tax=Saccharopolyspora pogona TaxID=333966 RepID=UPI00168610AF|nr:methyltransferase [Saccharopolyspora pogona]